MYRNTDILTSTRIWGTELFSHCTNVV